MEQGELNLLLDEGFKLWQSIAGHNPERTHFNHEEWTIRDQAEDLQQARRLDTTGLTAFMLLKTFSHQYIEDESVSVIDIIRGLSEGQIVRLEALRSLYSFLQRSEVDAILDTFVASVRSATKHYGIDHADLEAWLTDYRWMAILRRDALRSFEKLEAHQFFHGRPGTNDSVFYNTKIMEFWNIPSLVRAMQAQGLHGLRSVSLCLIRDPIEALHSFFVIAIVNGESLTVLTDRDRASHPLHKAMTRRPDKSFVRRAEQGWFPYELVNIQVSDDQRRLYAEARKAIVPVNAQAVELANFSSLHPADAIWLSLLFELIRWRYLEENLALLETSYTAEMVKEPLLLLAARRVTSIIPGETNLYMPLEAKKLKRADVTAETTRRQWGRTPVGHNEWMIERYGEQVPEEVLNVFGPEEKAAAEALPSVALVNNDNEQQWHSLARSEKPDLLQQFDPLSFGTQESIQNDRLWTARYNQCKVVQQHAGAEFNQTCEEVRSWLKMRFEERKNWLIEQGVRGELCVDEFFAYDEQPFTNCPPIKKTTNLVSFIIGKKPYRSYEFGLPYKSFALSEFRERPWGYMCAATEINDTCYHVRIRPKGAESLAILTGCTVDELPWQLQQWTYQKEPQYTGNSILERCDPSDWVLSNPWCEKTEFQICITFSLSKRFVNKKRKELFLPPVKWEK